MDEARPAGKCVVKPGHATSKNLLWLNGPSFALFIFIVLCCFSPSEKEGDEEGEGDYPRPPGRNGGESIQARVARCIRRVDQRLDVPHAIGWSG